MSQISNNMQQRIIESHLEICKAGEQSTTMQPGDFFLVHGDNFYSKLIELGQAIRFHGADKHFTYWTHAGMFLSNSGDIIEADGVGVMQNHISYYKDYKYVVVHVHASQEDREEMMQFVKSCLGDQYGWGTIASIGISLLTGLKFSFGFDGQEICSGLVCRALERTTFIPKTDASHTTPADLAKAFLIA